MLLESRIKVNVHKTYVCPILGRVIIQSGKTGFERSYFTAKHSIKTFSKSSLKSKMDNKIEWMEISVMPLTS